MLRIDENPPQRCPEGRPLMEDCGDWWVLYTKPRNEKALAWDMHRMGIKYYLPLTVKRVRRSNGKPRKSIICMFPGYVSVVNYPAYKQLLMRTGRIARIMEVENQERFVLELDQVRCLIDEVREFDLHDAPAIGQRAVIVSGPLEGMEGLISAPANSNRFFLNVDMFQRAISISVDPSLLMMIN